MPRRAFSFLKCKIFNGGVKLQEKIIENNIKILLNILMNKG
jgi:hypothetical protein